MQAEIDHAIDQLRHKNTVTLSSDNSELVINKRKDVFYISRFQKNTVMQRQKTSLEERAIFEIRKWFVYG